MKITNILVAFFICVTFAAVPAMAGVKYISGEPDISVAISGTNEFDPGDDVSLAIIVQNSGLKNSKIIQSSVVDRDDLPDTAKMVVVTLESGDAPVTVKSDPQMIGDIAGGLTKSLVFNLKVDKNAAPGEYNLDTVVKYKYLYNADQIGTDSIRYFYKDVNLEIALPLKINSDLDIEVGNVAVESMNVGTEGYISMDVKNTGYETGQDSVVKITRSPGSAVVPTDSSVFVGEFAPGEIKSVTFKAAVSDNGEAKNYPVLVSVDYKDSEGDQKTSDSVTIGVDVGGKVDFEAVSKTSEIHRVRRAR